MKNLKPISLLFLSFFIVVNVFSQTFKISGKVTGLPDKTWLFVRTSTPDVKLDSTQVINGKFILSGKMEHKITLVYLHTNKYADYLSFWLEEDPLTIDLKSGEFKKAIITGSKTQKEDDLLSKLKAPNIRLQDSLSQLITSTKDETYKKDLKKNLKDAQQLERELDINYVKNNPNSIIAVNLLQVYTSTWGKEKSAELYENLSAEMKNTTYGKTISNFLRLNKEIKIGGKFADFEQANTAGKKIKLSGIKAKYILLEFWGSWCGPCREENPNLVKTYNTYKAKGFEVLGVAADDNKAQWLKAIKDDQLPWENVSDLKGDKNEASLIYGINAFPTNYLIDEKGIIIAKNLRGDALSKKLQELLP